MRLAIEVDARSGFTAAADGLRAAAAAGCPAVALGVALESDLGPESPRDAWGQLAQLAGELAVSVALVHVEAAPPPPTTPRSTLLERVNRILERARIVQPPVLTLPTTMFCLGSRADDALRAAVDALRTVRFIGERHGVRVGISLAGDGIISSPFDLREMIDGANSYWVGAALDADACPGTLRPEEWIRQLSHRVATVRLARPDLDVLGALRATRFTGPIATPQIAFQEIAAAIQA